MISFGLDSQVTGHLAQNIANLILALFEEIEIKPEPFIKDIILKNRYLKLSISYMFIGQLRVHAQIQILFNSITRILHWQDLFDVIIDITELEPKSIRMTNGLLDRYDLVIIKSDSKNYISNKDDSDDIRFNKLIKEVLQDKKYKKLLECQHKAQKGGSTILYNFLNSLRESEEDCRMFLSKIHFINGKFPEAGEHVLIVNKNTPSCRMNIYVYNECDNSQIFLNHIITNMKVSKNPFDQTIPPNTEIMDGTIIGEFKHKGTYHLTILLLDENKQEVDKWEGMIKVKNGWRRNAILFIKHIIGPIPIIGPIITRNEEG